MWQQLKIAADPESAEPIEDALLTLGAAAVTFEDAADQPLYEPPRGELPLWQRTRVTALFDADCDTDLIMAALSNQLNWTELPSHQSEILEDRDWVRAWMDDFKPIQFGRSLAICPSWHTPEDDGMTHIMLDPGLAFGTGTHPTTALCLQWLDGVDCRDHLVIDYGCGSGILGIAALLLGAKSLIAVDNDPQALVATAENSSRNNISADRYQCFLPEQAPSDIQAPLVLANILAGPLQSLAPVLSQLTQAGGDLVLSGILENQCDEVYDSYRADFERVETRIKDGWGRLHLRKI